MINTGQVRPKPDLVGLIEPEQHSHNVIKHDRAARGSHQRVQASVHSLPPAARVARYCLLVTGPGHRTYSM